MNKHILSPLWKLGWLKAVLLTFGFLVGPISSAHALVNAKNIGGFLFTYENNENGVSVRPIIGAQVVLYYDDGDNNPDNDVMVSDADMEVGQQSQAVGPDGAYFFTVNPGAYRLKVVSADPLLGFPSTRYLWQNNQGTGDTFGDVFEGGAVVDHELMEVMSTQKYYLRFDLQDDSEDVSNNFVPLDPLTERVSIASSASLKSASVGDIVSYATLIKNQTNGTISIADGGVEVVEELPVGFELIKGSYAVFKVSAENQYTEITGLPEPSGRYLRFGAFELKANTNYEIRYNVQIKANAALGLQLNKTWLRKVDNEEPVTGLAGVAVMITPDTLLTTSTVLGHVFCDENDNQLQDINELGIGGVSVYLDNGGHVITDGSGLFHLSRVSAGMHLAKIDTLTLPPKSIPYDEGRARFYSSAGLPGEVSFPVACGNQWVSSDTIEVNENFFRPPGIPPRRLRDITVAGSLAPFGLTLDGAKEEIGYVKLKVTAEGESVKAKNRGPNLQGITDGELSSPLLFRTTFKKTDGLTWQLTILDLTKQPDT